MIRMRLDIAIVTTSDDHTTAPVTLAREDLQFDTLEEYNCFYQQVETWFAERPHHDGELKPFIKNHTPATAVELMRILDKMHGPSELWMQ